MLTRVGYLVATVVSCSLNDGLVLSLRGLLLSATCCDQPPVHVVVWCRSVANLLSRWCDSAIDDIHDIEPGYVRLRTRGILLVLSLLVQLKALLRC